MRITPPRVVTIALPLDYAERLAFSLSDLLCWHAGYASAKGDDTGNSPMGIHDAREFNIKLKSAIEEATHELS